MNEFTTHRDPEASLWQSAVDEALARRAGVGLPARPQPTHPVARVAALAGTLIAGLKTFKAALPAAAPAAPDLAEAADDDPSHFGPVVADLARRFPDSEADFTATLLKTKFSKLDPLWLEAAVNYHRFLKRHRDDVPYRRHQDLNDFVLDNKLPDRAKVALVSDWGTGTPEAAAVLKQIASHQPDLAIHLGDIYYSGLEGEIEDRFLKPWKETWDVSKGTTFTLAGNHDMYSGGEAYYGLIDQLQQPASYFCLRNARWQLIALDTGRNSGLKHKELTFLEPSEVEWLKHQIETAGGRKTILLSHHPLFSAFEAIGKEGDGVNHKLLAQLSPLLPQVTRWFWGHEHALTVYDRYLEVVSRCIGHGAIPVSDLLQPKKQENPTISVQKVQLGNNGYFFNHGYVIIELNGSAATARYHQSPAGQEPSFEESF